MTSIAGSDLDRRPELGALRYQLFSAVAGTVAEAKSGRAVFLVHEFRTAVADPALRLLHRRGLRFRKHRPVVAGLRCRPDIVFPTPQVAVEVRGCFWHLCPLDAVLPKSNLDYWLPKLQRNVERDRRNEAALAEAGWKLIAVWEHDDLIAAADRIEFAVLDSA